MNIPQLLNLFSQTFNSEFIEFVWQFPTTNNQIILKCWKSGATLLQEGTIDEGGDYMGDSYLTSGIITTKNISQKELTELKNEVVESLNNL